MRFALLALFAGLLSCQTATQITVKLRGVGVACPAGTAPTIEQTGVLAKRQLQSRADMSELSVLGELCEPSDGSVVSLGDIVLVPAEGPGPVEVLALGALKVGDGAAVSAEACRAEYERLFGAPCEIGEGRDCESCIFARRSIAFVKHSKLEVTIDLEASCAGVVCDPSQTCSNGVCVSAETTCDGDGPCTLVEENQGGAGGGGEGGQGGGEPGPWTPLWLPGDPDTVSCPNAHPADVIGGLIDNGQGERFQAFVPAGQCLLVLEDGAPPVPVHPAGNESDTAYGAVAQGADGDVIVFGDLGVARRQASFSQFGTTGLGNFLLNLTGTSWDVAGGSSTNVLAWSRTYPEGEGEVEPFPPSGLQAPLARPAVFTVYPAETQSEPVTFGAYGGLIAATRGLATIALPGNVPAAWSLWATEELSASETFRFVAVGGATNAVHVGRCEGQDVTCDGGVTVLTISQTPRKVVAIWGVPSTAGVALYAVGQADDGQERWFGRTTVPASNPSEDVEWTFAGLPDEILGFNNGAVSSVWVGDSGGGTQSVVIVGGAGVFRAAIDDLEFLPEP